MNILITASEGIGNTIAITPMVSAVRQLYKGDNIYLLIRARVGELLDLWEVPNTIIYNQKDLEGIEFDLHIPTYASYAQDYDKLKIKKSLEIPRKEEVTEVEINMLQARKLGFQDETPKMHVDIGRFAPIHEKKYLIGLSDTSLETEHWRRKKWPWFKELAKLLVKEFDCFVVFIGGSDNLKRYHDFKWSSSIWSFMGSLSLSDSAGVLNRCDFVIANDSGVYHMADALERPGIVLIGPTAAPKNLPVNDTMEVVNSGVGCIPCMSDKKKWNACKDWKCLSDIIPSDILKIVNLKLEKRR